MAGTYGWNIENTEEFIQNEGECIKMPMPFGTEGETTEDSQCSKPYIKSCMCSCLDSGDQNNEADDGQPQGSVEKGRLCQKNINLSYIWGEAYYWCASNGEIPAEAVKAGRDKDGGDIFVGRAIHEGELQPAKVVPNHDCAYIAFNGEEIRKDEYEILCRGQSTVIWQQCEEGAVPSSAVPVGYTADNERLFIGRVFHDGTHTPGKIQQSQGACCIPYGGVELRFSTYEVLILQ